MPRSNYGMLCIVAVYDELDLDVFRIASASLFRLERGSGLRDPD